MRLRDDSFLGCLSLCSFCLLLLAFKCCRCDDSSGSLYVSKFLRPAFEEAFYNKCVVYPFFDTFKRNLERPKSNNSIVYIFQEEKLANGGIGDRMAGLVTAMSIALRFNRSIRIHSRNGLDTLFRPFHHDRRSYTNTDPTRFDYKPSIDDKHGEYIGGNCVGVEDRGPAHISACSMDKGDLQHEILKLKCNRAYLCRLTLRDNPAYEEMSRLLGWNANGTTSTDLFRAAGCMLRLALWPTDKMWKLVGLAYEEAIKMQPHSSSGKEPGFKTTTPATGSELNVAAGANNSKRNHNHTNYWKHQIGLHYRCGDVSFDHNHDTNNDDTCYHDRGSLAEIAACANEVINNITESAKGKGVISRNTSVHSRDGGGGDEGSSNDVFTFITSDNTGSAKSLYHKINANSSYKFVSPPACHVDLDSSSACAESTFAYWMMLSFSSTIVSQGYSDGLTSSGFYLYAKIYGLKEDNWRNANGKLCGRHSEYPDVLLSRRQQGNWRCEPFKP